MQPETATNIASFVDAGGGLVTAEWTVWSANNETGWDAIEAILPVSYYDYTYPTLCTFTEVTPDPTLNYNLPASFDFVPSDVDGSFTQMYLKDGATEYYSAATDYDALVSVGMAGWDVGTNGGRVFSLSVVLAADELAAGTPTAQLLANSFAWTTDSAPSIPEPATFGLLGFFGGGLLTLRRIFRI